jgi:LysM repeat protein
MDEMDAKKRGSSLGSAGSLSSQDLGSGDSTPSKGMVMAALGVGVVGLLTGIIGIVMVNGTNSDLAALKEQVERTQDPQVVLKPTLDAMDERINNVGAEGMRSTNSIKDIDTKIQQIAQAISADREQINRNTAALGGHRAPAAKALNGAAPAASAPTTTNAAGQKVHTIQAGDTFSTLSRQYGVSVSAIKSANAGADSSHLKIGQQIVIPSETK